MDAVMWSPFRLLLALPGWPSARAPLPRGARGGTLPSYRFLPFFRYFKALLMTRKAMLCMATFMKFC